ncbi:hypothetical protein D3C77_268060 [compost metagenome]
MKTAQDMLKLAMQENGVSNCSINVERYLAGNAKCECVEVFLPTERHQRPKIGRKVTVLATGKVATFKTAKEACLFMAGKLAERRA